MLSTAAKTIVEQDKDLIGLTYLLDSKRLAQAIKTHNPRLLIQKITPVYIRYKAGMNCLVKYEAELQNKKIQFYAKTFAREQSVKLKKTWKRYERVKTKWPGAKPIPSLILKSINTVIHFFPIDNKLKNIAPLADVQATNRLLSALFPRQNSLVQHAELQSLRYKPERRLVVRLDIKQQPYAVLKFYTDSGYKKAKQASELPHRNNILNAPEIVAQDDKNNILAFQWLPSTSLKELIHSGIDATQPIKETARILASLHVQGRQYPMNLETTDEIKELQATAKTVIQILPELAEQIQLTVRVIEQKVRQQTPFLTTVHGDFYSDQVLLLTDTRISIIDWDRAAYDEPAKDIGNFIAHLQYDAHEQVISAKMAERYSRIFVETYQKHSDKSLQVELYTAIGLFRLLPEPFRTCRKNWDERIRNLLGSITRILQGDELDASVFPDPEMPYLNDALNTVKVQDKLQALYNESQMLVHQARLIRHKPGRRCLIEYTVSIDNQYQVLMGKIRARGADEKTYHLHHQLTVKGFDVSSSDGISVPEPVGVIPEYHLWLYKKAQGEPVINFLHNQDVELAGKITEAIHKLHNCGIKTKKHHGFDDELSILAQRLDLLASQKPQWQQRLKLLHSTCHMLVDKLPKQKSCGIHRDFYFDQLVYDQQECRLYLLDLDLYCESYPIIDIGNYIAHVMEYSLRRYGDISAHKLITDKIKNRIMQLSPEVDDKSIETSVTLSLVRLMQISTQFPERQVFTEQLLCICEQRLGLSNINKEHNNDNLLRHDGPDNEVLSG